MIFLLLIELGTFIFKSQNKSHHQQPQLNSMIVRSISRITSSIRHQVIHQPLKLLKLHLVSPFTNLQQYIQNVLQFPEKHPMINSIMDQVFRRITFQKEHTIIRIKQILFTQKRHLMVRRDVNEKFKIINDKISICYKLESFTAQEKDQEEKLRQVILQKKQDKVIKNYDQLQRSFLKYFQALPQNKQKKILQSEEQSRDGEIKIPQQIIRSWKNTTQYQKIIKRTSKVRKPQEILEEDWQNNFNLFKKYSKQTMNPTIISFPHLELSSQKQQTSIYQSMQDDKYFDLMLTKKQRQGEDKKIKPYKVIGMQITPFLNEDNYQQILWKMIQFKDYVVHNNLQFFNKIEFEAWIVSPYQITKEQQKEWIAQYNKLQKQLDKQNQKVSPDLTLRFITLEDIDILEPMVLQIPQLKKSRTFESVKFTLKDEYDRYMKQIRSCFKDE